MQNYLEEAQREIAKNRGEVIDRLVRYSLTDMLLFWGQEKDLIERQTEAWGPILKWASEELAAKFVTTQSLDVPEENRTSGYRLKQFMETLSDRELTAFYAAALKMRSVLLAAALVKGKINAEEAFRAAFLDELWQAETWGADEEAENRRQTIKNEICEIEKFLHSSDE